MDDLCQIAIPLTGSGPPAEIQVASRTRGASNQPVAEQPYGLVSEKVWEGLETAIANGDRLPNDEAKLAAKVQRRALLVAVSYENNWAPALGNQFPPLLSTPNDVWRVYKMLTKKCHYDPSNIRILVPGFSEINMPTKANIMSSLQWLVHGVEEGHYRYFHFSGHGDVIESKEGEGKAAREIPEHENKINPKDTELFTRGARRQTQSNERILTQEIPRGELRYYNEAILTSWVAGGWRRWTAYDDNRIRDRELNEAFAKLPKGSTLTCTLDCCHSGRMLNTNYKLAGNGFRGGWRSSTGLNSPPDSPSVAWETSFSQPLSDIRDAPAVRGRRTQGASAGTQNYFSAPIVDMSMDDNTIKMVETLPDQERIMDKINATMLAWSASQQRQKAVDYGNKMGGHFTYAFTHTVRNAPDEITTGDLHRNVEDKMNSEGNHPQYCQLWTSLGDGDESRARDKLKQIFTI